MQSNVKRFLGLSITQWLGVTLALFVAVGVWLLWLQPLLTLAYYRHSNVTTARAGLSSKGELVRMSAAIGLGVRGKAASEAIPDLIIALQDDSPQVASGAAWAIGGILSAQPCSNSPFQSQAVTALLEALEHDDDSVRRNAAYAFSQMKGASQPAIPRLTELLDDDHMAYMAARALGEIGPTAKGAVPKIAPLLTSSHAGERAEAAIALSKLQPLPPEIISDIKELLQDDVDFVRAAARKALSNINSSGSGR